MGEQAVNRAQDDSLDSQRPFSESTNRVISALRNDLVTAEVGRCLDEDEIPFILLKGPTIARWLYDGISERSYVDVDLLVDPSHVRRACESLQQLDFSRPQEDLALSRPRVVHTLVRDRDCALVDVHSSLPGVFATADYAWTVLSSIKETIIVAGQHVRVLSPPARLLHLVLHAAQHGTKGSQQVSDLDRAIAYVDRSTWGTAIDLAENLNATHFFFRGLQLTPAGKALIRAEGLTYHPSVESELLASYPPEEPPSAALAWEWFATRPGYRSKVAYIAEKLFPSRSYIRSRYPRVGNSESLLLLAYPVRWASLVYQGVTGLTGWWEARRTMKKFSDDK